MSDPRITAVVNAFGEALRTIDETEPKIRDMIEVRLADITNRKGSRAVAGSKIVRDLARDIAAIRAASIKAAFRLLRDTLPV